GQGADKIAPAELLKIEVILRCCGPQPESIDGFAAIAHHGPIVWNTDQATRATNHRVQRPSADLERGVELDRHRLVRSREFPGVRTAEPIVRLRALPAVLDSLSENPVLISQA